MRKTIKISAIIIAIFIATIGIPSVISAINIDQTNTLKAPEKECRCIDIDNNDDQLCAWFTQGVSVIRENQDIPDDYKTSNTINLYALELYCKDGTLPNGNWYGNATGFDINDIESNGLPTINAILLCFGIALVVLGFTIMAIAVVVTSVAIGLDILEAIAEADIMGDLIELAVNSFYNCVVLFEE